jgi:hypothetical protein
MRLSLIFILLLGLFFGCQEEEPPVRSTPDETWLIDRKLVVSGGVLKDGIPSVDNPKFVSAAQGTYIFEEELVVGFLTADGPVAFPHKILDWHEIVNTKMGDEPVSVIYCPLTGTATVWSRMLEGSETSYGISGLIHQNNIVPYDRLSDSHWSQMRGQCIEGRFRGRSPQYYPLVETSWANWIALYPDTEVLSDETGYDRNYYWFPYFDYRTNDIKISFPITHEDDRLPRKTRVLGVTFGVPEPRVKAKVYPLAVFGDSVRVIQDNIFTEKIVVVGSTLRNFAMCYLSNLNGEDLTFSPVQEAGPIVLQDQHGSQYDLFGTCVSGPNQGESLVPTYSFIGYFFAWADFQPNVPIWE